MGRNCNSCGHHYGIAREHCPNCGAENSSYRACAVTMATSDKYRTPTVKRKHRVGMIKILRMRSALGVQEAADMIERGVYWA